MKKILVIIGLMPLLVPVQALAHIKWFCAYDTEVPPLPIRDVVTTSFSAVALGFCALMFAAYVVDRATSTTSWAKQVDEAIARHGRYCEIILRLAVGVLFLVLWHDGGTILMPELKTANGLVPWLQLVISASMIFPATLILGAACIMALYFYAVAEYGAFHMMDYPVIPGLAAYLALTGRRGFNTLALPVLYSGVAATMMGGPSKNSATRAGHCL